MRVIYLPFYFFCILAVMGVAPCRAQISVSVSSTFSAIAHDNEISLRGDEHETFELPSTRLKDKYLIIAEITGGSLDIVAFDQINVDRDEPNPRFLLNKTLWGTTVVAVPASTSGRGVVVAFYNKSKFTRKVRYIAFRVGTRSASIRAPLQRVVETPIKALSKFYKLPKFGVTVAPCGTANAFSNPDITLCSELVSDLVEKDMIHALYPILYHELAHTLLRLWGLPGYDNEDFADEFAAAMLARTFPNYIETFSAYLESRDSTQEAIARLTKGSSHALSIDRARNMRAALENIDELEGRWGSLLKPFEIQISNKPRKKR